MGTGKRNTNRLSELGQLERNLVPSKLKDARTLTNGLKWIVVDSDARADDMDRKYRHLGRVYFRFTVEHGLEDVKLGESQKLADVATQTMAYIGQPFVTSALDEAAAALVCVENNSKRYYTLGQLSLSNEAVIQATVQQHTITQSLQTRKEFCRRWFSSATAATDPRHDLHDTLSKRFQRRDIGYTSCAWLLEKQEFKETLGGASSSVLWLKGRPGAGKSILALVVVDYLSSALLLLSPKMSADDAQ